MSVISGTSSLIFHINSSFQRKIWAALGSLVPDIEVYSIDENFLRLTQFAASDLAPFCQQIRKRVKRWTGIPTCVGLGPTKTLAKVANWMAKKRPEFHGVCDLRDPQARAELLPTVPLAEVWGIGKASAQKLAEFEVTTAADLVGGCSPWSALALYTNYGEFRVSPCRSWSRLARAWP